MVAAEDRGPAPADLDRELRIARQRSADAVEMLLESLFYACYDWIVDGREPELDQDQVRKAVKRDLDELAAALREQLARRGLTPGDLDARLGWPDGRTEHLLAEPSEMGDKEADVLCQELGTSMHELFASRSG